MPYNKILISLILCGLTLPGPAGAVENSLQTMRFEDEDRRRECSGAWPGRSILSDLNGDNKVDIVNSLAAYYEQRSGCEYQFSTFRWILNGDTKVPFGERTSVVPNTVKYGGVEEGSFGIQLRYPSFFVEDVNNDQKPDVVFFSVNSSDGTDIRASFNTGSSPLFTDPVLLDSLSIPIDRGIRIIDIDGDSTLDLISIHADGIVVIPNRGNSGNFGPFGDPVTIPVAPNSPAYLDVGDVNQDGHPDLLALLREGGVFESVLALYLNSGTDTPFSASSEFVAIDRGRLDGPIKLVDLDHDGDLDIAASLFADEYSHQYYLNGGSSDLFRNASAVTVGNAESERRFLFEDINQDGLIDLLLNGRYNYDVFLNTANPEKLFDTDSIIETNIAKDALAADLDGDGDLDFLRSDLAEMFLNNGFRGVPMPVLSVSDVDVAEDEGRADIQVNLDSPQTYPITLEFGTSPLSATPGEDFYGVFEALTFAPGETQKSVPITILEDNEVEADEDLYGVFSYLEGANITKNAIRVRIQDSSVGGDGRLSVLNASERESNGVLEFEVSLEAPLAQTVSARLTTRARADGATPGIDYTEKTEIIEFLPGETEKIFSVQIFDDFGELGSEGSERFDVVVSDLRNAILVTEEIVGTIYDDGTLSLSPNFSPFITEGETVELEYELDRPYPDGTLTIDIATVPETATQGEDYFGFYKRLSFAPGESKKTLTFVTVEDNIVEGDEGLELRLFNLNGWPPDPRFRNQGLLIVENSSLRPVINIEADDVQEGETVSLRISMTQQSRRGPVSVSYATRALTAVPGQDFYGTSGTVTFERDETEKIIDVQTIENDRTDPARSFEAHLYQIRNALPGQLKTGPIQILDDD